jgi:hypothetical protein
MNGPDAMCLFMIRSGKDGLLAATDAFTHSAILGDHGDARGADAWWAIGKAILKLLVSQTSAGPYRSAYLTVWHNCHGESEISLSAIAAEMIDGARKISEELKVLADAGLRGGQVSANTVQWISRRLVDEFDRLHTRIERLATLAGPQSLRAE